MGSWLALMLVVFCNEKRRIRCTGKLTKLLVNLLGDSPITKCVCGVLCREWGGNRERDPRANKSVCGSRWHWAEEHGAETRVLVSTREFYTREPPGKCQRTREPRGVHEFEARYVLQMIIDRAK